MTLFFFKFPSTLHISKPAQGKLREDKILLPDEKRILFEESVAVEEKIDGANVGISFDENGNCRVQNRGSYIESTGKNQFSSLKTWTNRRIETLADHLGSRYILFGEWCYARHTVFYDSLPGYFIGFDLYDREKEAFLSVVKRNEILHSLNVPCVPQVFQGKLGSEKFLKTLLKSSAFSSQPMEGLYVRYDDQAFSKLRGKLVRGNFLQKDEQHWSSRVLEKNLLRSSSTSS